MTGFEELFCTLECQFLIFIFLLGNSGLFVILILWLILDALTQRSIHSLNLQLLVLSYLPSEMQQSTSLLT